MSLASFLTDRLSTVSKFEVNDVTNVGNNVYLGSNCIFLKFNFFYFVYDQNENSIHTFVTRTNTKLSFKDAINKFLETEDVGGDIDNIEMNFGTTGVTVKHGDVDSPFYDIIISYETNPQKIENNSCLVYVNESCEDETIVDINTKLKSMSFFNDTVLPMFKSGRDSKSRLTVFAVSKGNVSKIDSTKIDALLILNENSIKFQKHFQLGTEVLWMWLEEDNNSVHKYMDIQSDMKIKTVTKF